MSSVPLSEMYRMQIQKSGNQREIASNERKICNGDKESTLMDFIVLECLQLSVHINLSRIVLLEV
jgi:hypothetical protein